MEMGDPKFILKAAAIGLVTVSLGVWGLVSRDIFWVRDWACVIVGGFLLIFLGVVWIKNKYRDK
jgi:putative Mn2+ efflux pump MntP